ncbi:peptidyl-glycine alpha-amidating monooxygenase [Anopheles darlingi]|uniref:peptidylamidoglycolate lyase n=1 Tax=Anopheles darlingi TaxID=43151 RepID=W5JRY6_ANODA|nr:peptidyl-glycine alpha-amidating monooxygenase [Anopheles darlingi]
MLTPFTMFRGSIHLPSLSSLLWFGFYYLTVVAARPNLVDNGTDSRLSDHEFTYVSSWPIVDRKLGSVSAVAINGGGNVVILHRGSHVWNIASFDVKNNYLNATGGPIAERTVLTFDRNSGQLLHEWGEDLFYMPHGLTIDHEQNYWITDVALHQVFKFNVSHSTKEPVLSLGQRFQPGNDFYHFCKPTSVAVLPSGDFFVADGYCNGRIIKYTPEGIPILSWGRNSFILTRTFNLPSGPIPTSFFAIPHALTVVPKQDLLCVADREQGRVQCFHTANGTYHSQFHSDEIGTRLFSVKYVEYDGTDLLYIINGPQFNIDSKPIVGFIYEMGANRVVGHFRPENSLHAFSNPHELAVSDDGVEVYVAELNPQMVHKFQRVTHHGEDVRSSTLLKQSAELPTAAPRQMENNVDIRPINMKDSSAGGGLTVGTIQIFSIVSTLLTTAFLVVLMARIFCFRPSTGASERTDEFTLVGLQDRDDDM